MRSLPLTSTALLAGALMACGGAQPTKTAAPPQARVSRADTRKAVAITVYNDGFGLVREVRDVDVGTGRISLEFRDVSSRIEPNTVHVKGRALSVLEQNYRYDLLSPQKLLEKYEGKKIKLYRWNKELGKDEVYEAEVLSVNDNQPVLKVGNEITYGFPARFAFAEVPANLIAEPSLVWLLDSKEPKQELEVTYLTQGFGWSADYVLTVGDEAAGSAVSHADLVGWVTLQNNTSTTYENAQLKLVAGNVQRVLRDALMPMGAVSNLPEENIQQRQQFAEESFFEYHLYTLERPTSLLSNEQKQVTLLEAHGIDVHRQLIFYGASYYYRGSYGQVVSNQKVGVYLEIKNEETNHLGMPLPKGTVRVYKADKSGASQFIGEDSIDHTPRDEKLRIKMGESFDVVGDRKQTTFKAISSCIDETSWEISLRNHKDVADEVLVYEPIDGDWQVLSSSLPYDKKDAHTFTFTASVPSRGETKITYRVRVKWC
jgi:hypothetical protein